jgi:quinol monooxygenase YgiN
VIRTLSGPGPPFPRRRRFRALAAAREEALEEGNYDLARKLLELDIEQREKIASTPKPKERPMRTITLVHHRVADFDAWKQVYDEFADVQREGGVRWQHVWRDREDPSMVVVIHMFDDAEAAKAFFDQPDLKETMERAGVDPSSVRIEFLDEVGGGAP